MKVVLDTSAILSGFHLKDDLEYFVTSEVLDEVRDREALLRLELAKKDGSLKVAAPGEQHLVAVKKAAESLGEDAALSDADISTLAIALEFKDGGDEVVIVSDDYGIQNVASSLNIKYLSLTERGIDRIFSWHYICTGCGERYEKNILLCEICGSKVKRRVKHR